MGNWAEVFINLGIVVAVFAAIGGALIWTNRNGGGGS